MNKSELESKHISELHDLAAEAGVERYRMLSRSELIAKLADGGGGGGQQQQQQRPPRQRRERKPRERREPRERAEQREKPEKRKEPQPAPAPAPAAAAPPAERPKRKRRRRRWGRRRKRGGSREHADRWLDAWNRRDLDEIVSCYAERVEFVLPAVVGDTEARKIEGREALREHFRHGLELAPNLSVAEESLLEGPGGFAILYRREDGHRAIEAVELDDDGLAVRVSVFYERD